MSDSPHDAAPPHAESATAPAQRIDAALSRRFGPDAPRADAAGAALPDMLALMAGHAVTRRFSDWPVPDELVRMLCACALSAPSKSDLQQRDIILVDDPDIRAAIHARTPGMAWMHAAPVFLVFCANGSRVPQLADWRDKPFPNTHFDLLFNGIGDAAICLAWFQLAVESVGLGGCPISEVRNFAADLSDWLGLPDRVIPYAGFCLGWPDAAPEISPRLPLKVTLHRNRHSEDGLRDAIEAYDARRAALQPAKRQRGEGRWGIAAEYGWSEDKARQYAEPLRADFGAFVRARGYSTD
jgi:nitroreductase/FMN reductase [NAD(P)H]